MNVIQKNKIWPYVQLMRLDRPIGTLLLLWPTWWALWTASEGVPNWQHWLIFTVGVFLMRAAGCVINDILDRKFDGYVKRTLNRPLPQNMISVNQAWGLFTSLLVLASCLLFFLNNLLTIYLALAAAFFAVTYPLMKRLIYLPQVYLGIAFSFSIPMAYAEITNGIPKTAWLLFIANILWTTAYDTIYAMIDRKDDMRIGIKSTAILFGDLDKIIIGILQTMTVFALLLFGIQSQMTIAYYTAIIFALCLFIHQQFQIAKRDEKRCFIAFLQNNWIGIMIFLGIFFHYLLK